MKNLFAFLALAGLVLILLSAVSRVPLWIGCFITALALVLMIVK